MAVKFTLGSFKLNTTLTDEEEKRIAASMWAGATKKELLEKISEMTISSFRQGIRIELLKEALRQIDPYLAVLNYSPIRLSVKNGKISRTHCKTCRKGRLMLSHSLLSNGGNHADDREENDFYATEPAAADLLNKAEWSINRLGMIWECACGQGHLSKRFDQLGYHVFSSDKINRGFGVTLDFLNANEFTTSDNSLFDFPFGYYDIVTNPPYRLADKFIEKGNELIHHGNKLCLF